MTLGNLEGMDAERRSPEFSPLGRTSHRVIDEASNAARAARTHAEDPLDACRGGFAGGPWGPAIESMPIGLAALDAEGRIIRANACMAHLLGRVQASLVGVSIGSLVLANDREAWLRDRSEVLRHGRPVFDRERRFYRPDGVLVWLSLSVAPIAAAGPDGDPDARMALSVFDVSSRRCLQEVFEHGQAELRDLVETRTSELRAAHLRLRLADRMAAVGTLGAGLGHDMNNVLLPVRAHLNALEPSAVRAGDGEHVTAIRQSLSYLQQLADGLHYLAMDPDQDNVQGDTDLGEWWSEVGAVIPKAVSKQIAFACDLPPDLPRIAVEPHRLTQAVLNLVVNAGEAFDGVDRSEELADRSAEASGDDDGRPRGRVRLFAERDPERPTEIVRIAVSDDGMGMSPDVARRAGGLYYTTKVRGMGTGLGLALVRMVVDRAGGTMQIESTSGEGTTVILALPVSPRISCELPVDLEATSDLVGRRDDPGGSHIVFHGPSVPMVPHEPGAS
jgi:PAS domain S-box-containing protein